MQASFDFFSATLPVWREEAVESEAGRLADGVAYARLSFVEAVAR